MRSALSGKTSLIIVPDGALWNLPFQALQASDGRYLIEDAAVSYAPSVTVLRETMRPRAARPAASELLAFGNPAVGAGAGAGGGDSSEPTRGGLAPLPETEREVQQLAAIYGPSSRVYVGAEAREGRLKAEAASYRVVHLATHGVLDNASPLYSHLVLARPERGGQNDGLLEAWEIMDMQLRADLVVLSACETASRACGGGRGRHRSDVGRLCRGISRDAGEPVAGGLGELDGADGGVPSRVGRRPAQGVESACAAAGLAEGAAHPRILPSVLLGRVHPRR